MSLYTDLVEAKIEIGNWQSDLHVKYCPEAIALIRKHGLRGETFQSKIDGSIWVDIPFQYEPYWGKMRKVS